MKKWGEEGGGLGFGPFYGTLFGFCGDFWSRIGEKRGGLEYLAYLWHSIHCFVSISVSF